MISGLQKIIFFSLASFYSLTFADDIAPQIEILLKKARLKNANVGILIKKIENGKTIYSHNDTTPLNPASTLKVIVANAALDNLGTNYRFLTKVYKQGEDLCLKGGGDPALVQEKMMLLAEDAIRSGKRVVGNLILDESLFPQEMPYDASFVEDSERAFVSKVGALSINFNSLTFFGEPTNLGQLAAVTPDPNFSFIKIDNKARTQAKGSKADLDAEVFISEEGMKASTRGFVGKNTPRVAIYRTVPDPALYAGFIFREFYVRGGGTLSGKLKKGTCASSSQEIASLESKPLAHIVEDLNKFSNNFIAEMLLRALSPQHTKEAGLEVVQQWLKKNQLSLPSLVMENASGLSRKNRISASDLESVVRFGFKHPKFGAEFTSSLPIGATDGTMKRRFTSNPSAAYIRGKSGSLSNVTSLTGVLFSPAYGWVSYAFIFNNQDKNNWQLMEFENDILSLFI